MTETLEFDVNVRKNPSAFGEYGKIVSKHLAPFIDKRVHVKIKLIKENKKT